MHKISNSARCAVVGYGSWATALVKVLMENERKVAWHIRKEDVLCHIASTGSNPKYLPEIKFDTQRLLLSGDINDIVSGSDIIILAVPSAFLKETLEPVDVPLEGKFIISAIKGIIPDEYLTVAEYINRRYGSPFDDIGIIAGPCHSEEVAMERLSYLTIVCKNIENAEVLCRKFRTPYIHANPSTDIYGVEYAAVLKNIYAICAGIAAGLGYGDNFISVLVSNAAIEMNRFMAESYPAERDTSASAYLGDLIVTCYSHFSRNRTFGTKIGSGADVRTTVAGMSMVAEGYYSSECIRQVNKRFGIDMPIADCVHRILYEGQEPATEMKRMAERLF